MDLVGLSPKNEYLRDTLFKSVFRNDVVVQFEEDMAALKGTQEEGLVGSVYSLDGYCVNDSGLYSVLPKKLDYIFGMQNLRELALHEGSAVLCTFAFFFKARLTFLCSCRNRITKKTQ